MTDTDETPVVKITINTVYKELVDMKDGFAELRGLLEKTVALQEQRNESVETRLENHGTRLADQSSQIVSIDSRVTKLEDARDQAEKVSVRRATWPQIVGVITGIVAGGGALLAIFTTLAKIATALP